MVVVKTRHPRALSRAANKIERFLDPLHAGKWAYEGFYFEAEGAFAFANANRGTVMGSQWARSERLYPFEHG
jgi:hypothetical protein